MHYFRKLASLGNLGFRASTLVLRFLLSFYIVKFLGYEATGVYGLTIGAIGITPALLGWGLNYFVSREIVGKTQVFVASRMKTRLLVTTISLAVATVIGLLVSFAIGFPVTFLHGLIIALLWLETYGLDIHLPLISAEMPLQANMIVFLRSAFWVPFAIGVGIAFPALRSLDVLFMFWIGSYVLAAAALVYFLRDWPIRQAFLGPFQYDWLKERLRYSWHIYGSDLSIVGLAYADRYIVSYLLGLTLTGIYTFFWSIGNALQTLMQTAVIQLALPRLFRASKQGSANEWQVIFRRELGRTILFASLLGIGIFIAAEILISSMSMSDLGQHRGLFVLLLCAAIVRSCSDLLNIGLSSLEKDKHYAAINILGVCMSICIAGISIYIMGLIGTGVAALLTALLLMMIRLFVITRSSSNRSSLSAP
ncbi:MULTISPECIES: lipopolysaccharide biosynthesis protein [unclassified Rhizobium]|uniref:lipopolysaccharide biosynthesis protein n=1 Tax=unclassified Rhizobium TaxID=2613769 RepID=UPI0011601433|nr:MULTISPECIES: lipopolysaccharide biosynthesis protein [unclassified Rhizobium]TQX85330.1 lipopolysaccharide biosynthesis protein [Rhizobium sp. rho-13.1]TQY09865.1 lipopolysaccharide biosynthesis protein [Rhizobium sp. rho-1.1]